MARQRTVEAPKRNDVYVGMLGLAAFAMLVGIALLAFDASDYDWQSEAKAGPALNLPKIERKATPAPGEGATPPAGDGAAPAGAGK
jgi:hypothetical protein